MRTSLRFAIGIVLALGTLTACRSRGEKVAHLMDDLRSPDPKTVDRAVRELVEMGEAAVPSLIPALKDPEVRVRSAAAAALWGLGPKARGAVYALAEALGDSDNGVRLGVAMALEGVGPAASPAVPALAKAVRERDGNVRLWAAKALGRIGPPARDALPALTAAARIESTRGAVEDAIRAIKGPGAPADAR